MMRIEQENIPEDWNVKILGDIADVSSGGSAPQGDKYFDGESPFVRVQHIDQDTDSINRYDLITDEAVKKYKLKKYKAGTIVFPKSGASIYLEKRAVLPVDAYIASHLCAVNSAQRDVYQDFLFYSLKHILLSKGKADGYPTLNLSEVKRVAIPVPAFEEQKKVVRVLSVIKKAIAQQEKIIAKIKELKRSLMHRLFTYGLRGEELKETEIGLMPESWDVVSLKDIFKLTSGKTRPKQLMPNSMGNFIYPVYGGNGIMGFSEEFLIDFQTVVLGRVGEYCGCVHLTSNKSWISDNALYAKEILQKCSLFYLAMILEKLDLNRMRNTGGQPLISQSIVYSHKIPFPSNKEQEEIANVILTTDKKIQQAETRTKTLRSLFKSMLQLLMTGQVRVKDIDFREINV